MSSTLQPISQDTQEQVLKNRMAIDDRALRRLIKKFSSILSSSDAEALSLNTASFRAEVTSYQTSLRRLLSISSSTCPRETSGYAEELDEILAAQRRARDEIDELKATLASAKLERKQKLDYDNVAASIQHLPPRHQLGASLETLGATLDGIREESANVDAVAGEARGRMANVVGLLESLVKDVGDEVGRNERREVQREEVDGEADADADAEEAEGEPEAEAEAESRRRRTGGEGEGEVEQVDMDTTDVVASSSALPRSGSTTALNAAAAPFQPGPSSSTTTGTATAAALPSKRRSKREPASDEEGQLDDLPSSSSSSTNRLPASKRLKPESNVVDSEAGEEGQVESQNTAATHTAADSEEEEGSIQPVVRNQRARPQRGARR
ncbi:uncharacterized protein PFL1_06861 [Pseudozyma flocculosa PF-1]|uniref:Uncharacterized protein n=2 Tax=Pseudozyma flocculosa TaxID=84751 RepID=A0A5C3F1S7_9BASI|nr:uncharacterized protein PFL1_06861 [Pseudozyma flocculosa PF-1]EPQ29488.1 hypothetical protein PFL1_06861 [Pseudozyma flocculosa PF-1]SPO38020.1 uncharacterized protein PSFLO_03497 [Pseudozyma flocculosa]